MSQHVFRAPLDIYVAKGHGRSYGKVSSCLGKKIPGIFLEQEKSVPITAFVTDIGNDLAYEVPVETILEWVEACFDHLSALGARVVLSDLPMDVLKHLKESRYRLFRALFFPQCRLDWHEMLHRAEQLSEGLQGLAKSREVPVFTGRIDWYGLDPIHVRRHFYPAMWSQLFSLVAETNNDSLSPRYPFTLAWYLRSLRPAKWSTFSISRRAPQPNGQLRNGSTISLY